MTKFYLVRHGQTDWNLEGRLQGHVDTTLNEKGISQAHQAASNFEDLNIDLIIASLLLRALQTASIISQHINVPVYLDEQLKERSFGSFEGKILSEMKAKHGLSPNDTVSEILPDDAEQWPETLERASSTVSKWLENHSGKKILFVSHGGFFKALYESLTGNYFNQKVENAMPYLFEKVKGEWNIGP